MNRRLLTQFFVALIICVSYSDQKDVSRIFDIYPTKSIQARVYDGSTAVVTLHFKVSS